VFDATVTVVVGVPQRPSQLVHGALQSGCARRISGVTQPPFLTRVLDHRTRKDLHPPQIVVIAHP
jgi:hypothetical protein